MQLAAFAASLGTLVTVAVLDYATGYELLFHLFYFIPVGLAAWFGGKRTTWAISVLAGVAWWAVDYADGHTYSREIFRYWNAGMFLTSFVLAGLLLVRLKRALIEARQHAAETAAALRELEQSTIQLRRLEGSFQVVCSWTNQIKDGDEWVSFQEFLHRRLSIRLSHGISPEGIKKIKKDFP